MNKTALDRSSLSIQTFKSYSVGLLIISLLLLQFSNTLSPQLYQQWLVFETQIDLNKFSEHSKPDKEGKKSTSQGNEKAEDKTKSNGESKSSRKSRFLFHRKKKDKSEGEKSSEAAGEASKSNEK